MTSRQDPGGLPPACAGGCACTDPTALAPDFAASAASAPAAGQRRKLGALLGLMLTPLLPSAWAQGSGRVGKKPMAGDRLAFAMGDRKGEKITPADIEAGQDPVLAHPMDPGGKALESRANLLAVIRLPEDVLSPEVKPHAPQGIVAYSAVCTHYGCPVTKAEPAQHTLVCNCHGSAFDASRRGVVTIGPATRRLPMMPLKMDGDDLVINGVLDGPIGPPT